MHETKRPLKVFLCHASIDKPKVRELYRYLRRRGINPWFDEEHLVGGQDWQVEIPKALATSDAIIICLTKNSVDKEGYIQKEIKFALDKALEMPEGRIFLIPVKFEECEVPFSLSRYQWVDLTIESGYSKMMKALKFRASQLERSTVELSKKTVEEESLAIEKAAKEKAEDEAAEKAAREKAEQEAAEKTQLEAKEQARQKAAKEKSEREAAEKATREKAEQEAVGKTRLEAEELARQKAAKQKAEREVAEKATREKAEKESVEKARLKAEELASQKAAKEKAERESAEKIAREKTEKEVAEKITRSTQNRILEAAIQEQVVVDKPASLYVWIKRVGAKSIISVVKSDVDENAVLDKNSVKSKRLEVEFPFEKGAMGKAKVSLRLVAPEFSPPTQQKEIKVPVNADSDVCTFLVTPKKAGKLLLNIEVLKDEFSVVNRSLWTTAVNGSVKEVNPMVLMSIPIVVVVQPQLDIININGNVSDSVIVSGDENAINTKKQAKKVGAPIALALMGVLATFLVAVFGTSISGILSNKATPTFVVTKTPTLTKTFTPTPTKTKISTKTSTPTSTSVPFYDILFQDHFDYGNASLWDPSDGTTSTVKEDETGNYIYEITGPNNYPQTWVGDKDWSDYAFESRIRIKKGTVFILVRSTGSYFYNVSINTSDISLARWDRDKNEYEVVQNVKHPIQLNKWYLVRVEINGQQYKLYIDNKLITSHFYPSDSPVIKGGVGYYIGGGETVQIDDARVWTLK
jgi:hypothetical protein